MDREPLLPDVTGYADRQFLISANGQYRYADLNSRAEEWSLRELPEEGKPVLAIPGDYSLDALSFQFYAAGEDRIIVAPVDWQHGVRENRIQSLRPDWVWSGDSAWTGWQRNHEAQQYPQVQQLQGGGLVLPTTGTTGARKWVLHRISSFVARYQRKPSEAGLRVLPLMNPDHVAGQDIFWRALWSGATLVIPEAWTPEAVGEAVSRHQVQFLAATPSYLRVLWLRGVLQHYDWSSVERISYGGEVMPTTLLKTLRTALPGVKWEQRYGMSELATLSARDAGEGFLSFAMAPDTWKVEGEELWIRRPASWVGYLGETSTQNAGEWFSTGDRVLVREDGAMRILGRAGLLINVGGEKVSPEEVEMRIAEIPGILSCRVYGEKHPLMGNIVAVDLHVAEERRSENWRLTVRSWCHGKLPQAAIPVQVRIVEAEPEWRSKIQR